MKKVKLIIVTIIPIIILGVIGAIGYKLGDTKSDIVIYGNIYTGVDGKVSQAAVIKDDEYIFVGSKEEAHQYISNNTKVMTYDEGIILAGFTDTHTHVTPSFATAEYQINISEGSSVDDYVNMIKTYIEENPDEEMYIGRGFNYMLFEDGAPTKDILDEIEPNKPIFIKSADGHSAWINSKMIELTGVDETTENPIGGTIVKDVNGNITGYFKDAAMDVYVKPNIKPYSVEQYKSLIMKAQNYYAELGYTAYIEVFVEADNTNYNIYKAYEELDNEHKLLLRVQGAWNVANNENALDNLKKIIKYKDESKGGMFELTDVKIFMDGVAETKTAYLSEPYSNDPDNYGADRWPGEEGFNRLVDLIVLASQNDVVVHFHAIGDAAITKALDATQKARESYINPNIHNVITHFEIVKESDIQRLKDLDIVVSADLSWGCKTEDTYESVEVSNLGEERAEKAYPYKSALEAGAVVSLATDYPAGAVSSPIAGYVAAVIRNSTDDESYVRDASQKMTVDEALMATTYGGAYQMRQENIRGTIEVGKKADLIVLDTNLLESHEVKTLDTKVLLNIVNGNIVYENK